MAAVVVVGGLAALGCADLDGKIEVVCDHLCDCRTALPGPHRECVAACIGDLSNNDEPPPGCFACVQGASCADLDRSDTCALECSGPPNPVGSTADPQPATSTPAELP